MKKVFSFEKYVIDMYNNSYDADHESLFNSLKSGWPQKCDGLTMEECNQLGIFVSVSWMEEK